MPIRGGDVEFGIRITADNQVFVEGVRASREEIDKLGDGLKKVSSEQQGATRSQESLTGAVFKGNLAMEAARFAGDALVATWRTMREDARANEIAQLQIATVLQSTSFAALKTSRDIELLAETMAHNTFFDGTAIKGAAAQILTFDKIAGDSFDRVIKAGGNLAALFGGDLVQRAAQVARALEDPEHSLGAIERVIGRLNPGVREYAIKLAQMGEAAAAQKVILDELERKMGNVAETMKTGMRAEADNLAKSWRDLLAEFGKPGFLSDAGAAVLGAIAQKLRDIKSVVEDGDWWQKILLLYNPAATIGGSKPKEETPEDRRRKVEALLNAELEAKRKFDEEMLDQDQRLERVAKANQEKAQKEKDRLRDLDNRGWVAHIEAEITEFERGLRAEATLRDEFWKGEDAKRKLDDKGWVAYIDAQIEEYERGLRQIAEKQPSNFEAMAQQWTGFMSGIEGAFRQTWDAFGSGAHNAAQVARSALQRVLFDWIWQQFAKPIVLNFVLGAANILGLTGLAAAARAAGGGTGVGSSLSNIGGGLSIGNWLTGASATAGNWLGSTAVGQFYGGMVGNIAGPAAPGTALSYGQSVGAWASSLWWILPIIAGMLANDAMFSRGWRTDNQDTTERIGGALGTVSFADRLLRGLGFNDRWASLISGSSLSARFWGLGPVHPDAFGIRGDITGTGYTGETWQDFSRRGGVFRSDRRWTENAPFSGEQADFFARLFRGVSASTGAFGRLLGIDPVAALAGYSHPFNVQLSENGEIDQARVAQIFGDLFGQVLQEQTASLFDTAGRSELANYVRELKGSGEEITAMIGELLDVMSGLQHTNLSLSVESLMAWRREGESLGQAFQRVAGQISQFDDAFMTDAQKLDRARQFIADTFGSLGVAIPASAQSFYDLVHGLDLSTEAGRNMFDALMSVAPAFLTVQNAAASAVATFNSIASSLSPAFGVSNARSVLEASVRSWMALSPANQQGWTVESTIGNIGSLIQSGNLGDALSYAQSLGGNAVNVLNAMLSAYQAWQQALNTGTGTMTTGISNFGGAIDHAADAAAELARQTADAKQGIGDWLTGIFLDQNLSPLTPFDRLDYAHNTYTENLLKAQMGDLGALQNATSFADLYLKELLSYYGPGFDYMQAFAGVTGQMGSLAGLSDARPPTALDLKGGFKSVVDAIERMEANVGMLLRQNTDTVAKSSSRASQTLKEAINDGELSFSALAR